MNISINKPIILLFNQITDTILDILHERGYINNDGIPNKNVTFRISASPFNIRQGQKSTRIKTFIDAVKASNGAYCMPVYGDVLPALVENSLVTNSVIPYSLGIDDIVVQKGILKWHMIARWLEASKLPDAKDILNSGNRFMTTLFKYVTQYGSSLTPEQYHKEVLDAHFGPNWYDISENLNSSKFLKLFGASDTMLEEFANAKVLNDNGIYVELLNEGRWVANFIRLFKPITQFKSGSVADILNFAAMFSSHKFPDKPTDKDSLKALQTFDYKSSEFNLVRDTFFDMEPDDVAVITFVLKYCPNANITRVYPTEQIANIVEAILSAKMKFRSSDSILIDPLLDNAKILKSIYSV